MANVDQAFGFRPWRHARGGVIRASQNYTIASGLAANIFTGDPVKMTGTGRNITVCAAGDTVVGIFQGCEYTNSKGERVFSRYWPTGTVATEIVAHVIDDPDVEFLVKCDEDVVEADIGNKADYVAGAGDTKTGLSGFMLDSSDVGNGDGLLLRSLAPLPDNDYGDDAIVVVMLREHALRGALTAV